MPCPRATCRGFPGAGQGRERPPFDHAARRGLAPRRPAGFLRAAAAAVMLLAAAGACSQGAPLVRHERPPFVVFARGDSPVVDAAAAEASRAVEAIASELRLPLPREGLRIYVFPSRRQMKSFLSAYCPKQAGMAAACFASESGYTVVLAENPDERVMLAQLRHELTHYVLASRYADFPPWADEGLSQHFEKEPPGALDDGERRALARSAAAAGGEEVEALVSVPYGGALTPGQYRLSRSLVHFLLSDGRHGVAAMKCYLEEFRSDGRPLAHLEACFGASPEDLAGQVRRFYSAAGP